MGNARSSIVIEDTFACHITGWKTENGTDVYIKDECCKETQGTYIWPLFYEAYYFGYSGRAVIYLIVLLWLFMGVAQIADIFMCAIEEITSQTRKVRIAKARPNSPGRLESSTQRKSISLKEAKNQNIEYEEIEVKIWNDTVANLTLMALGSSAPEIILAVVEIIFNNFEAGALGPGTIVGSASFNLLVITAICIMGIPDGESRRIKRYTVFGVTAIFSLFAYAWIYLVIMVISPERIEIWEATATLVLFPVLVVIAYAADRKLLKFRWRRPEGSTGHNEITVNKTHVSIDGMQNEDLLDSSHELGQPPIYGAGGSLKLTNDEQIKEYIEKLHASNPGMDPDKMAKLLASKFGNETKKSRAWYRVNETRKFMGGEKIQTHVSAENQVGLGNKEIDF